MKALTNRSRAERRTFSLAAAALASILSTTSSAGLASPLDPTADPAVVRAAVEAINRKPLPRGEPLAQAVASAIGADARRRGGCIPTSIALGRLEPATLDGMIIAMISRGEIENAWLLSVRLVSCPATDPIRVLLFRAADGQRLQAVFAGQGESLAWPSLAREALRMAVDRAVRRLRIADPECAPRDLTPTAIRIAGRSPDLGPSVYGVRLKGWWTEVWAFEPCGHRIAVPISFTTDGRGGARWDIDAERIVYVP